MATRMACPLRQGLTLKTPLPQKVQVTVLDRQPVTNDKNVEIRRTAARPEPAVYKQEERGAPISGGLKWVVAVAPGERSHIEFQYRLTFGAKSELVGGNRRE
mgnify:CR=1 FL=1